MQPSLVSDAGAKFRLAMLLLAPSKAALSDAEIEALILLIKETSMGQIKDALKTVEKPGAVAVTSAMMTRFSSLAGMSEVSDIVSLAGKYMDINQVMPPDGSLWKPSLIESMLPDSANAAIDGVADFMMALVVPIAKEYTTDDPVDMVRDSSQTPGYVSTLFTTLDSNIKGIEMDVKDTPGDGDSASIGWRTVLIGMLGAAVVGGLGYAAVSALISALSADGETTNSVTRDDVIRTAKAIGVDIPGATEISSVIDR